MREYVETKVKMHPIWHNEHFWEEAFYMSTREEMAKHFSRRGSVSGAAGGTDTYQLVCFGQLGSYSLSMINFGCGPEVSGVRGAMEYTGIGTGVMCGGTGCVCGWMKNS